MTAKEAQELSAKCRIPHMQPIYDAIKDAAMQGNTHVNVGITKQLSWGVKEAIAILEALGYTITDKENREKLHINWRLK